MLADNSAREGSERARVCEYINGLHCVWFEVYRVSGYDMRACHRCFIHHFKPSDELTFHRFQHTENISIVLRYSFWYVAYASEKQM